MCNSNASANAPSEDADAARRQLDRDFLDFEADVADRPPCTSSCAPCTNHIAQRIGAAAARRRRRRRTLARPPSEMVRVTAKNQTLTDGGRRRTSGELDWAAWALSWERAWLKAADADAPTTPPPYIFSRGNWSSLR